MAVGLILLYLYTITTTTTTDSFTTLHGRSSIAQKFVRTVSMVGSDSGPVKIHSKMVPKWIL